MSVKRTLAKSNKASEKLIKADELYKQYDEQLKTS